MSAKPKKSAVAALRPIKLPAAERSLLSNGLELVIAPRGPLPVVAVRVILPWAAVHDPEGKSGRSDFAARLLRRGAGGVAASALAERIEHVGASISAWANDDLVGLALSTPARDFDAMMELFALVVRQPDFPESELELARRRRLAQIANGLDDPDWLAARAVHRATYGDHPYGRDTGGTAKDLERIQRQDLLDFKARALVPGGARMYVVGECDPDQVRKTVERTFGPMEGSATPAQPLPTLERAAEAGKVILVDKPDQTQAQIRIGGAGFRRGHPDHFALTITNAVLGGAFSSRLGTQIRIKRGLAYGASSHFDMMKHAGSFQFESATKTSTAATLVEIAFAEIQKMRAKGPTETEASRARRFIAGLYPARMETNDALANALADVDFHNLGKDWIPQFRERVMATTAKQCAEVASRLLPSREEMTLAVVGNAEELRPALKKFGEVRVIKPTELA